MFLSSMVDQVILQDINYSFHPGCKYAVVGECGSGKATLTKIIPGLLPGYTGDIRYSQVEQKHICLKNLHRHITYVDQQVYLFQDTIRFNITSGQPFADRKIRAVIKRCHLEDFVNSLPDSLDTVIKENGKNLSIMTRAICSASGQSSVIIPFPIHNPLFGIFNQFLQPALK